MNLSSLKALSVREPARPQNRWLFGALLACALSGLVSVFHISYGALNNLNDIGGWPPRALFILMAGVVHFLLLMMTTALHRDSYARLALRQLIVTAGFYIAELAINQKTYVFMEQLLPLIRQMDEGGLSAIALMNTTLSSPALTLLYAVTRGPIYDMYMVKLLCMGCYCALCLLAMYAGERLKLGWRTEVLLTFCLILPQGFISAACSAQLDIVCLLLLGASLACLFARRPHPLAGAILYGLAIAMSGFALYALPIYVLLISDGHLRMRHLAVCAGVVLLCCLPAVLAGQGMDAALLSLVRANFSLPTYASGSPSLMSLFPRVAIEEMPEYFILKQLPALDPVTNFSPYYTQAGYAMIMHGLTLAALAMYALLAVYLARNVSMPVLNRALALSLGACLICPGATASAWLLCCMLCVLAILARPQLRVAACTVLFATAGASVYAVSAEILLPMIVALTLCLLALFAVLGLFDGWEKGLTEDA